MYKHTYIDTYIHRYMHDVSSKLINKSLNVDIIVDLFKQSASGRIKIARAGRAKVSTVVFAAIPVSAKITTVAIKGHIERYAFHMIFCGSERISLHLALYGDGRYFRRHRYFEAALFSSILAILLHEHI